MEVGDDGAAGARAAMQVAEAAEARLARLLARAMGRAGTEPEVTGQARRELEARGLVA